MCLLTFFPEGSQPSMKDLENGALYNDDGHGFAIVDPDKNKLIVRKSMDADILLELFEEMRKKYPNGPAIFHSRIGTAGSRDKSNCHPFYITGTAFKTVIAHNGILPAKAQPPVGERRSDTRMLAEDWLPKGRFGAYHTRPGRKALGKWAGAGNKFAILTVDPNMDGNSFLVNQEQGDWEDGPSGPIWYSNSSHDCSYWGGWRGMSSTSSSHYGGWWNEPSGLTSGEKDGSLDKREGEWVKNDKGSYVFREFGRAIVDLTAIAAKATADKKNAELELFSDRICNFCGANEWVNEFPYLCGFCLSCNVCAEWGGDCQCQRSGAKEQEYVQWWLKQESENEHGAFLAAIDAQRDMDQS